LKKKSRGKSPEKGNLKNLDEGGDSKTSDTLVKNPAVQRKRGKGDPLH